MIVNLRTLRDGGPLTKTTESSTVGCSVTFTLSWADDVGQQPPSLTDAVCTVTATPRSTATGVRIRTSFAGSCGGVDMRSTTRLPEPPEPPAGASGASADDPSRFRLAQGYVNVVNFGARWLRQESNIIYHKIVFGGVWVLRLHRATGEIFPTTTWRVVSGTKGETFDSRGLGYRLSNTWRDPLDTRRTAYARTWVIVSDSLAVQCDNRLTFNFPVDNRLIARDEECNIGTNLR